VLDERTKSYEESLKDIPYSPLFVRFRISLKSNSAAAKAYLETLVMEHMGGQLESRVEFLDSQDDIINSPSRESKLSLKSEKPKGFGIARVTSVLN